VTGFNCLLLRCSSTRCGIAREEVFFAARFPSNYLEGSEIMSRFSPFFSSACTLFVVGCPAIYIYKPIMRSSSPVSSAHRAMSVNYLVQRTLHYSKTGSDDLTSNIEPPFFTLFRRLRQIKLLKVQ